MRPNAPSLLALSVLGCTLLSTSALAELKTQTVEYEVNGESFTGYLAYDDEQEGKRPGVLVVHEWWGHDEFAREQAEKLAEEGYTAFALDMYGTGKQADHPEDAKQYMQATMSNMEQMVARFEAARDILTGHETVDDSRIAGQGYCFGGAVVLTMARSGMDLDGVVSLHGALGTEMEVEPGDITARIQAYTGGADPMVPADQVAGFVREMHNAEADFSVTSFPGVQHSFTNPGADEKGEKFDLPVAYDEEAAMRSWEGTMAFYKDIFAEE